MRSVWLTLTALLVLFMSLGGLAASADSSSDSSSEKLSSDPMIAAIQSALKSEQDNKETKDIYNEALALAKQRQQLSTEIKKYKKALKEYPEQRKQLQNRSPLQGINHKLLNSASLNDIDQAETQLKARLVSLQGQQRDIRDDLEKLNERIVELPGALADARKAYEAAQNQVPDDNQAPEMQEAVKSRHDARVGMLELKLQALELEQLSAPNRQELLRYRLENVDSDIDQVKAFLQKLSKHKDHIQNEQTARSLAESNQIVADNASDDPEVKQAVEKNRSLAEELKAQHQLRESAQERLAAAEQIDSRIKSLVDELKQGAKWLQFSVELSRNMTEQLLAINDLPKQDKGQIAIDLNRIRMAQYRYQREQQEASKLLREQDAVLHKLAESRVSLLQQLQSSADELEQLLRRLQTQVSSTEDRRQTLNDLVSEELVWRPNVHAVNTGFFVDLAKQFGELARTLKTEAMQIIQSGWQSGIPLLLVVLGWLYSKRMTRRFKEHLDHIAPNIGNVRRDRVFYTPVAVCSSFALAAWLPIVAWASLRTLEPDYGYWGDLLILITIVLGIRLNIRLLLNEQGILATHYRLSEEFLQKLRRGILRLLPLASLCALWLVWAMRTSSEAWLSPFGRCGAILSCSLTIFALYWLFKNIELVAGKREHWPLRYRIAHWLALLMPTLALLLFLVGYILAGAIIYISVLFTLISFFLVMLALHVSLRIMTVLLRRVAFERALARRNDALAKREAEQHEEDPENEVAASETVETVEESIPLDDLGQQSMKMVTSFALLLFYFSLLPIWNNLFNTFGELNEWTLWSVSQGAGEAAQNVDISVKAAVTAIITAIFTAISIRNLPGLLELLVLQNITLRPGTGYAITAVTKYLILVIGLLTAMTLLGLEWSQLQWLVAALTVGLGFGLQEIFANFVSGLIILFEKPIRIGDTVTIRNWSGNISKINTRATTLVDWDRKEVLIPNKAFVTEDFVNWTLSDAITRLVVSVGVAYGSDIDKVQELLLKAAEQTPILLEDPIPEVYFLKFDDSSLSFELRAFVSQLGSRLPAVHQLHTQISRLFAENGIEISYPQMDLHVRDMAPIPQSMAEVKEADQQHESH